MVLRLSFVLGLLGLLAISGCGFGGNSEYAVTGTVTFENAPLPEGDIIFEPADGKTQHRAEKIKAGKYTLTAPAGPKIVRIFATKEVGQRDKVMNMVSRAQYIPARYNEKSELKAEVSNDSSKNTFDFKLSDDKPSGP